MSQNIPDVQHAQMSAAAAEFVEAHAAARWSGMLRDAGAPGRPGSAGLGSPRSRLTWRAAALALQLLQALTPYHREHRTAAVQDLWSKAFLCARSPSA